MEEEDEVLRQLQDRWNELELLGPGSISSSSATKLAELVLGCGSLSPVGEGGKKGLHLSSPAWGSGEYTGGVSVSSYSNAAFTFFIASS